MNARAHHKSRDGSYVPDWLEKQLVGLHPDAQTAFVRIHGQCWNEGCHGSEYGVRFKELLDREIFGDAPPRRCIASAERVAGPPSGIQITYSDGTTKFEPDGDSWTRCYPSNRARAA